MRIAKWRGRAMSHQPNRHRDQQPHPDLRIPHGGESPGPYHPPGRTIRLGGAGRRREDHDAPNAGRILTPTEGDAVVAGHSVRKEPEALKGKIAYMSQRF